MAGSESSGIPDQVGQQPATFPGGEPTPDSDGLLILHGVSETRPAHRATVADPLRGLRGLLRTLSVGGREEHLGVDGPARG